MNYAEKVHKLLNENGGILTASLMRENNIPTVYLTRLTREGKLKRVARGVYISREGIYDELFMLQTRFPKIIFSYETALYLLNLTDKIPGNIHLTVNHKYKFNQNLENARIYYVNKEILNLGVIEKRTNAGNIVRLYSAERTLCDFIKNKSEVDPEVYINFLKAYPSYSDKDINELFNIAQKMDIVQQVQEIMELVYE
ncbi:MAG: type IV toxin-antitoxin system AbiEi family antitoxin domain-containing protein [Acutalibacteraceae bacterium]|jgi:predicted transcriptional regulator of viral defense system